MYAKAGSSPWKESQDQIRNRRLTYILSSKTFNALLNYYLKNLLCYGQKLSWCIFFSKNEHAKYNHFLIFAMHWRKKTWINSSRVWVHFQRGVLAMIFGLQSLKSSCDKCNQMREISLSHLTNKTFKLIWALWGDCSEKQ